MDLSWFMISLSDIGLAGFCHASKSCDEGMLTSGTRAYVWEEETWYKVFQSCYLLFQMCYHSLFLELRYLEILWYVAIVLVIFSITIFSQISVNTWHFNVHYTLLLFIITNLWKDRHKSKTATRSKEAGCTVDSVWVHWFAVGKPFGESRVGLKAKGEKGTSWVGGNVHYLLSVGGCMILHNC